MEDVPHAFVSFMESFSEVVYKLTDHFETDYHDLENPGNFKDNCVVMGYTVVALWTDLVFDLFKPEIQKREQSQLKDEELRNRAK